MKILFLGDIVGKVGRRVVVNNLEKIVKKYQVDFIIANGENVTHGKGLIEKHYYELLDAGIDCITLGNHYLSKDKLLDYIDDADALIRPLNIYWMWFVKICAQRISACVLRLIPIVVVAFLLPEQFALELPNSFGAFALFFIT
jgi:hypothetical protein